MKLTRFVHPEKRRKALEVLAQIRNGKIRLGFLLRFVLSQWLPVCLVPHCVVCLLSKDVAHFVLPPPLFLVMIRLPPCVHARTR